MTSRGYSAAHCFFGCKNNIRSLSLDKIQLFAISHFTGPYVLGFRVKEILITSWKVFLFLEGKYDMPRMARGLDI